MEKDTEQSPTSLSAIDEQLCQLINKRKAMAFSAARTDEKERAYLAEKYQFQEAFLEAFFDLLENEEHYTPEVQPLHFKQYLPVLKAVEKEQVLYSVMYIRQYENISVVPLNIDWTASPTSPEFFFNYDFKLTIEPASYHCRLSSGGGSESTATSFFTVEPALPEDLKDIKLHFTGYPFSVQGEKPTEEKISLSFDLN